MKKTDDIAKIMKRQGYKEKPGGGRDPFTGKPTRVFYCKLGPPLPKTSKRKPEKTKDKSS